MGHSGRHGQSANQKKKVKWPGHLARRGAPKDAAFASSMPSVKHHCGGEARLRVLDSLYAKTQRHRYFLSELQRARRDERMATRAQARAKLLEARLVRVCRRLEAALDGGERST